MGEYFSISELIRILGKTFCAMDIRCAAIREGEIWTNYIMVVRLTYETPETANERLRKLETQHGQVNTESFRIIFETRPFGDWNDFCKDISRGLVSVGGSQISLSPGIPYENESVQLHRESALIRSFDGQRWPYAELRLRPHQGSKLHERPLSRELAEIGYPDPSEAVNSLCELNVSMGTSEFCLSLPIFAALHDARVISADGRIELVVRRHRELCNLQGFAYFREGNFRNGPPSKMRINIPIAPESKDAPIIRTVTASASLPEVNYDQFADLRLIFSELGEIDALSRMVRDFVPAAEKNILFEALKRFCPENELKQLLLSPHETKVKKYNESSVFETSVAWLLGTFSFPSLILGKQHEHIKAKDTKVQLASVDILATDPKGRTLFLVACSLGPPKEDDFTRILHAREILLREVFRETAVTVKAIVFSGARGYGQYKEIQGDFVPVIDLDAIEILLALLAAGREADFLQFLDNPQLSFLRIPTAST